MSLCFRPGHTLRRPLLFDLGVQLLGLKQVGDSVNLESDLIGKYVERLLEERNRLPKTTPVIDKDYLQKRGLI